MTSKATVTKARIFIACCTSIMLLVSCIYSMTFIFTKSILQEMILNQKDIKFNLRASKESKDSILDNYVSTAVQTEVVHEDMDLKTDNNANKLKKEKKQNDNKEKIEKKQKTETQPKKKKEEKKKKKMQVWKEESSDIGEITSSGNLLNDTTIIVTTNWMPSVPSTDQLDKIINSLSSLHGLPKDAPMIIAIDGPYAGGARYESVRNVDMRNYADAIRAKYNKPHITIISSDKKIMLVGNMKRSLRKVHTQYVLVLQHDLPFINEVNHTALIDTMETYPDVRLVRFATAPVLTRKRDGGICDKKEVDFEADNGIQLTKTHVWSDRNHLTRKSYYAEMFKLPGWGGARYMENLMEKAGKKDCSYWGTYLFGPRGGNPTIFHMDGRHDGLHMTSTKRVYGNMTGLLD